MNMNMNFYALIALLISSQIQAILSSDPQNDPESKKELEYMDKLRQLINIEKILYKMKKPELDENHLEADSYDELEPNADDYDFGNNEAKRSAYLRFGRSPAFLRFGRNQAYLRFGKSYGNFGAKRNPTYLRFGRSV
ncbi:hypothetical protein BpHYR1_049289 [Brachionus plicatilis]|uniref:Uncharacterized protein n=1 Tax=Brachionus plicatilis TaxID=10195 RepID=A0A3M7P6D3_BRAPC|nr:hypothetical protein BpHYR1_049289 [Brachionus plicatilis]